MSSDSMLVFHEAEASEMANLFSQKATLVRDFIPRRQQRGHQGGR